VRWFCQQHPKNTQGLDMNRVETLNQINCKSFSTTWKHCVRNTYIHLPTFGMQMKQVCKQEGLTMWRSYLDMDPMISMEWSPKAWNWWLFLSISMLLDNQSQILTFSKDEKRKGTTLKNEFTPQWACTIKRRLTNTCFAHGCFTFKKMF
jgi:hypothetical protein